MSPRAALRLEALGFTRVYDYAAGKSDWTAAGLPTEGPGSKQPRAGHVLSRVPVCQTGETIGEVAARLGGPAACVVTTADGVVQGRLGEKAWAAPPETSAADAMEPGPTTVRYNESLPELVHRMGKAGVGEILVTDADGRLLGLLLREDGEELVRRVQRQHEHHHH